MCLTSTFGFSRNPDYYVASYVVRLYGTVSILVILFVYKIIYLLILYTVFPIEKCAIIF